MGWGVGVCQQQAGQLGCVVLTLQERGTRVCSVLPIILGLLREAEEVGAPAGLSPWEGSWCSHKDLVRHSLYSFPRRRIGR